MTNPVTDETLVFKSSLSKPSTDALSLSLPLIFLIAGLFIAAVLAVRVGDWHKFITSSFLIKYLPMWFLVLAIVTSTFLQSPSRTIARWVTVFRSNWYLTAFMILALSGSIYIKLTSKQETSYFSQAIMLFSFVGTLFVLEGIPECYWPQMRRWLVRSYGLLAVCGLFVVLLNLSQNFEKSKPETVFLVAQGVAWCFYLLKGSLRSVLTLIFALITILTFKNTAIVILLLEGIVFYLFPRRSHRKLSFINIFGLGFISFLIIIVVGAAYFTVEDQLSDGHTDFRKELIAYQFETFKNSPVWGQFFTGETRVLFQRDNVYVPTHNDLMDIMAQGGIIGTFLFAGGLIHLFNLLLGVRRRQIDQDPIAMDLASWLFVFLIAAIVSFTFNPILGSPSISFIIWVGIAFAHRLSHNALRFNRI